MQEVMTRIELGGEPGKIFGKIHHRLINKVSEAGTALAKTIPGLTCSPLINTPRC